MNGFDGVFRHEWLQKSLVHLNVHDDHLWKPFHSTPDNYAVLIFNLSGQYAYLNT